MVNNLLYVVIGLFILNILVNMFMIYHICEKIELINKEVHCNNSYVIERLGGLIEKKNNK